MNDDFKSRIRRNLRELDRHQKLSNPNALNAMRFMRTLCDKKGIKHNYDDVLGPR